MSGEDNLLDILRHSFEVLKKVNNEIEPARERLINLSRMLYVEVREGFKFLYIMDMDNAKKQLNKASKYVKLITHDLQKNEDSITILKKIVYDSLREFVEFKLLYLIISGERIEKHDFKYIDPSIVLDGFVDLAGEIYRLTISNLIEGSCEKADKNVKLLEKIYLEFLSNPLDSYVYKDYKRKVDRLRSLVDKVKSDFLYRCSRYEH